MLFRQTHYWTFGLTDLHFLLDVNVTGALNCFHPLSNVLFSHDYLFYMRSLSLCLNSDGSVGINAEIRKTPLIVIELVVTENTVKYSLKYAPVGKVLVLLLF